MADWHKAFCRVTRLTFSKVFFAPDTIVSYHPTLVSFYIVMLFYARACLRMYTCQYCRRQYALNHTHTKKKPLRQQLGYICLFVQCVSAPVWSRSMGNRVHFITVPVLFTWVTPVTTIWLAFLLQHLLWTTEDKMAVQQSSSLFAHCSSVPGHGCFHTSCGQCPCTHQP